MLPVGLFVCQNHPGFLETHLKSRRCDVVSHCCSVQMWQRARPGGGAWEDQVGQSTECDLSSSPEEEEVEAGGGGGGGGGREAALRAACDGHNNAWPPSEKIT